MEQGVLSDLEESIELLCAALLFHPPGHLARSLSFNNPAPTLQERFRLQGAPS
ncbi:uncharacterized protein BJ212DRAFT_1322783, partial [Suillus subaureus]